VAVSDTSPLGGHPIVEAAIMFGTLLESRGRRRRRPGGAAVSVAVHMAIIGAVTATTVHGRVAQTEKASPVLIHFTNPPAPPPVAHTTRTVASGPTTNIAAIPIRHIEVPQSIPMHLPPIDSSFGRGTDSIVIGHGGPDRGLARSIVDGEERSGSNEWRGSELQTRIIASAKPRYPESLRQAAVDGRVLVRFVVDTMGRIDMSSVSIVASTHDLFTHAVREALPGFRFKPAEVGGQHVRALAEMPFEFQLTK
jgi:protein TonB